MENLSSWKTQQKTKAKIGSEDERNEPQNEEERKQTEEASWWGNDGNGGSRFQVGEDMTGEGCRRRHVEQPT